MKNNHHHHQQASMLHLVRNSHVVKVLSCFLLFGSGIAFGFIFSSYFATTPLFSVQNIQFTPSWSSPPPPSVPFHSVSSFSSSSSSSSSSSHPPPEPENDSFSSSTSTYSSPPSQASTLPPVIEEVTNKEVKPSVSLPPPIEESTNKKLKPPISILAPPIEESTHTKLKPTFTLPPPIEDSTLVGLNNPVGQKFMLKPISSDLELLRRASMVPRVAQHPQKVAFMFLIRGALPFMPYWEKFFTGHEGLFSIYIHADPHYGEIVPEASVFYNRRIPSKITSPIIMEELRLLFVDNL